MMTQDLGRVKIKAVVAYPRQVQSTSLLMFGRILTLFRSITPASDSCMFVLLYHWVCECVFRGTVCMPLLYFIELYPEFNVVSLHLLLKHRLNRSQ